MNDKSKDDYKEEIKEQMIENELKEKGAVAAWILRTPYYIKTIIYIKEYRKEGNKVYRVMKYRPDKRDKKLKPKGRRNYYYPDNLESFIDTVEENIIEKYSVSYERMKI